MLLVGDDWAEDHHDVEVVDEDGQVLARRRLPNGLDGIAVLHALIGEHLPEGWADWEPAQVAGMVTVGIETDRGPWVAALVAAGYEVFAINPMSVARYRERHSTSGAKSTARTRTCWPRSCALTGHTIGRLPVTATRVRRSS
jgi:transposase